MLVTRPRVQVSVIYVDPASFSNKPEQMGAPQTAVSGEKVSGCQLASCHRPLLQVPPSLPSARASTPESLQPKQTGRPSRSSTLLLTWLGWQISEGMVSGQGARDKQQAPRAEGSNIFYLAQRERERGYVSTTPTDTGILGC